MKEEILKELKVEVRKEFETGIFFDLTLPGTDYNTAYISIFYDRRTNDIRIPWYSVFHIPGVVEKILPAIMKDEVLRKEYTKVIDLEINKEEKKILNEKLNKLASLYRLFF